MAFVRVLVHLEVNVYFDVVCWVFLTLEMIPHGIGFLVCFSFILYVLREKEFSYFIN